MFISLISTFQIKHLIKRCTRMILQSYNMCITNYMLILKVFVMRFSTQFLEYQSTILFNILRLNAERNENKEQLVKMLV